MAAGPIAERNQDATIYVGGLDEKVSETLLWELFLEAGPVGETLFCTTLYCSIHFQSYKSSLVKRKVASRSDNINFRPYVYMYHNYGIRSERAYAERSYYTATSRLRVCGVHGRG